MILLILVGCMLLGINSNGVTRDLERYRYLTKVTASPGNSEIPNYLFQAYEIPLYKRCEGDLRTSKGLIIRHYKRGSAMNGETCKWIIRAPENKVVDIVLLSFNLVSDEKPAHNDRNLAESTVCSFFDYSRPKGEQLIDRFFISPLENFKRFTQPIQGKEIFVEMKYHDLIDYSTQTVFIRWETRDADDV